jgi:hypothetical protein
MLVHKVEDEPGRPTVQVAGEGEPATAAVAQRALELVKRATA